MYAAGLGLDASPHRPYAPGEARVLLAVESLASDRDLDLRDQYRESAWRRWDGAALEPAAGLTQGRLHEPTGVGFPLLAWAAYAAGGPLAVEALVAVLAAAAFAAAALLARRVVPDPWATAGAVVLGLSPPAVAWATTISPEPVAAAAITGAALLALHIREQPGAATAFWCAALIALLPWLGVKFAPAAAVLAYALARWLRRRQRALAAFVAVEVILIPTVVLISVTERLYGGLTPYDPLPGSPTGAQGVGEHLERVSRLPSLLLGPETGVLVLAPFAVLAVLGLALLARSIGDRLAVALPGQVDVEVAAVLVAALVGVQVVVSVFLAPDLVGSAFPGRELVPAAGAAAALAAWGLRRAPRLGAALGAATVAATAWTLAAARLGDATLAPPHGPLPWGDAGPAVAVLVGAAALYLVGREAWREWAERRAARGQVAL